MRYPALDALRGIAALGVVLHHHLLTLPQIFPYPQGATGPLAWLLYSPLHVLWGGQEAVYFFFVLSGFVLTLGVWQGQALDMATFVPRRLWRIWVPMVVAVTVAWGCRALIGHAPLGGVSEWFNWSWQAPAAPAYAQHLLMLGRMDHLPTATAFVPVVWSLKWEMWGSLLLPLVILVARQRGLVLLGVLGLVVLGTAATAYGTFWRNMVTYLPMFVLGAVLARHREGLARWVSGVPMWTRPALFVLAALLLGAHWYRYPLDGWRLHAADMLTLTGAAIMLCLALGWTGLRALLLRPALQWLGQVSYSLYLYHTLVLLVVVRLGHNVLPLPALLLLSLALSFPVAHLAWRWVELPAMRRGQRRKAAATPSNSASAPL